MADYHGITITEVDSGPTAAATISTSVIGLVGTGGTAPADDPFPVNTPVRVTNFASIDTDLGGNLAQAVKDIYRQTRAEIVIVRVAASADISPTTDDGTGVYALKSAQSQIGYRPKIILSADATDKADYDAFKAVANSLRAIAIIDLNELTVPDAADNAVDLSASGSGSSRCIAAWPFVRSEAGGTPRTPSPFIAGAIAKRDTERGFWWSPSNARIDGIAALQFGISDEDAEALNDAKVATFRRTAGGFVLWGNKSLYITTLATDDSSGDGDEYQFIAVRRVADAIYDTLDQALAWAQDRPISANLVNDIQEYVNGYMANLRAQGAILNGTCTIDPSRNTPAALADGNLTVDITFEPPAPAEKITIRATRNQDYYEEVIS